MKSLPFTTATPPHRTFFTAATGQSIDWQLASALMRIVTQTVVREAFAPFPEARIGWRRLYTSTGITPSKRWPVTLGRIEVVASNHARLAGIAAVGEAASGLQPRIRIANGTGHLVWS